MSMKNSSDTIGNRTCDRPAGSAWLNQLPHRVTPRQESKHINIKVHWIEIRRDSVRWNESSCQLCMKNLWFPCRRGISSPAKPISAELNFGTGLCWEWIQLYNSCLTQIPAPRRPLHHWSLQSLRTPLPSGAWSTLMLTPYVMLRWPTASTVSDCT
jgi:hypothetical protein